MRLVLLRRAGRSKARRMPFTAWVWWYLLAVAAVWLAALPAGAQESAESRAFKNAARWYQTGVYDAAEREFQKFATDFPQSPMLAEAILFQARAALEQTNVVRAIAILNQNLPKAGLLTDQYRYRLGTAYLQSSNFTAAAGSFALIARQFPNSGLLLETSYGEALARFKLRDFDRVISLLQDPLMQVRLSRKREFIKTE